MRCEGQVREQLAKDKGVQCAALSPPFITTDEAEVRVSLTDDQAVLAFQRSSRRHSMRDPEP